MKKIIYSLIAVVTMMCAVECSAQTVSGNKDGHDYVDLGLPSGKLWATYNVGASKSTEYGDYFAWGETTPKEKYDWSTYKWCKGSEDSLTKYCVDSKYGTVDGLTNLIAEDDAATKNWGSNWRMPTRAEQDELRKGCDWDWTNDFNGSGVAGQIGTSRVNGSIIFLPAAGHRDDTFHLDAGDNGCYWSSSIFKNDVESACNLLFNSEGIFPSILSRLSRRYNGLYVRAVVK